MVMKKKPTTRKLKSLVYRGQKLYIDKITNEKGVIHYRVMVDLDDRDYGWSKNKETAIKQAEKIIDRYNPNDWAHPVKVLPKKSTKSKKIIKKAVVKKPTTKKTCKKIKIVWFHKNSIDGIYHTVYWGSTPTMFNKTFKEFRNQKQSIDFFKEQINKYTKKGYKVKSQRIVE